MKYKVGDKVRIKSLDWYGKYANKNGIIVCGNYYFTQNMLKYCGKVLMITNVIRDFYVCKDIDYQFSDEMIEGLAEEPIILNGKEVMLKLADIELPSGTTNIWKCPEGYQFKDENGNVINATKIVLEKKKKASLTQEQINVMIHESCVLFCKHCGCGISRDTCLSLGTCNDHDEYRSTIRAYLMNKYKD